MKTDGTNCKIIQLYTMSQSYYANSFKINFWRRNFFFVLANPVYKMWIKQEPNTLELWNKLHFADEKTESIYHV